jgi:hypothetical protein
MQKPQNRRALWSLFAQMVSDRRCNHEFDAIGDGPRAIRPWGIYGNYLSSASTARPKDQHSGRW